VGSLRSAIEEWALEEISSLSDQELSDQLVELNSAISSLECQRARRLSLFGQRQAWKGEGHVSGPAFLSERCKMSPSRAKGLLSQAESLSEMPETMAAWADDRLSPDQTRQLVAARDANPDLFSAGEKELLSQIEELDLRETARTVNQWRQRVNAEQRNRELEALRHRRFLHLSPTIEGMGKIEGLLDPESFELVRTAVEGACPIPTATDHRSPGQRRADALVDLCREAMDSGRLAESGGEKPHLIVLIDSERIGGQPSGSGETLEGTELPQSDLERLLCDSSVSRMIMGAASEPLDVGRKTRVIPPALRRAVMVRDRHCRHPGCDRPARWCDVDHIIPWWKGGETKLSNLQLLCRFHHSLKHQGQGPQPGVMVPEQVPKASSPAVNSTRSPSSRNGP
jgi:hypothetical protein